MDETDLEAVLATHEPHIREIARRLRALVVATVPEAIEEPDLSAGLIGFTFLPGTYTGLIVAIAPHTGHVNLMFSRGVELLDADTAGLLEGTGKKARHIRFDDPGDVRRPEVHALIEHAAGRTPRA